MASPVSPLAVPLPELPPLAGVRLGAAAAGIRYQGRTDLVMMELAAGTTVAGVFTSSKCPGAPVDWCRAVAGRRQGARGGGERRQRQRVHRQGRARCLRGDRGGGGEAGGLPGEAGVHRLHRRDRRGAAAREAGGGAAGAARRPARRCVGGGGARHHDHRHLPQGRHAHRADRRGRGADQRHRQGQRHDRARHGDDAVLRVHRREAAGRRDAGAAEEGRRCQLQLHHGRLGYLDVGHGAAVRHRPGEASARAGGRRRACWPISRARWMRCCSTWRCRWCATARARRSWCASMSPARPRRGRRSGSGWRWRTRRW